MKCVSGFLPILFALFISATGAEHVELYAQEGGTVTLSLKKWDKKEVYVKWFFDSDLVVSRNPFGDAQPVEQWKGRLSLSKDDFSLTITGIKLEEFQSFKCEQFISVPKETRVTTFTLHSISIERPAYLLAGETLTLTITRQKKIPGAKIRWLDPKQKQRDSQSKNSHLTVRAVTGEDNGDWTCVVTHESDRKIHVKTHVTVIDLSPAPPQPLYSSPSSPPSLPCVFPSHNSLPDLYAKGLRSVRWTFTASQAEGTHPGDVLATFNLDTRNWMVYTNKSLDLSAMQKNPLDFTLKIKSLAPGDGGNYTCTLEFNKTHLNSINNKIQLEVLHIVASPGTNLSEGHDVNLTCSLGHPLNPDLTLKWSPPRQPFPKSNGPLLTIRARAEYTGAWRCELWRNTTKLMSTDIRLKIDPAPIAAWLLITICAAAVVVILILTVILIRRHRKRLMPRRRKHRFCRCKDPKPKGFYLS